MRPEDEESGSSDSSSASDGLVNLDEDKEWIDAENDDESLTFVSLFDDKTFSALQPMLDHCKDHYQFDLVAIVQMFGMYLVHYISHYEAMADAVRDVR